MEIPREEEFTVLPNFLLKYPKFNQTTILLLLTIRRTATLGMCTLTNAQLAKHFDYSERHIQRLLKTLVKAGFITIAVDNSEGGLREMYCVWDWGVDWGDKNVGGVSKTGEFKGGGDKNVGGGKKNTVNTEQNGELFEGGGDIGTYICNKEESKIKNKSKRNKEGVDWSIRFDGRRLIFSDHPKALKYYSGRYPGLEVGKLLVVMADWLRDNGPKKDYHRFITNWLRNTASREKIVRPGASSRDFHQSGQPTYRQPPKIDFDELLRKGRGEAI